MYIQKVTQGRHAEVEIDKQTDRQAGRQTDKNKKQTDREKGTQLD